MRHAAFMPRQLLLRADDISRQHWVIIYLARFMRFQIVAFLDDMI